MRPDKSFHLTRYVAVLGALLCSGLAGQALTQTSAPAPNSSSVASVEITSTQANYEVGQHVKFSAVAKDESGKPLNEKPANWVALPFDVAAIDENAYRHFSGLIKSCRTGFIDGRKVERRREPPNRLFGAQLA